MSGWAVWITGLPGCGKSSVARWVLEELRARGVDPVHLAMDERRKAYFPEPAYTAEERDAAYRMFVEEAADYAAQDRGVVMDATGHRRLYRDWARKLIPHFAEAYLSCDMITAMQREAARKKGSVMAGLYAKSLERRRTGREFPGLGEVVGVDVPFEASPDAELVVESSHTPADVAARRIVERLIVPWLGQD